MRARITALFSAIRSDQSQSLSADPHRRRCDDVGVGWTFLKPKTAQYVGYTYRWSRHAHAGWSSSCIFCPASCFTSKMAEDKLKRTRKSHPKTKSGCLTCKIRRKKCGEEKPACLRCTSTGRKCDGYITTPAKGLPTPPTSPENVLDSWADLETSTSTKNSASIDSIVHRL